MPAPALCDPEARYLRDVVRFEHDPVARYVVRCHPEGLTAPQVSRVLRLAVSNVHKDQARALTKLRALADDPEYADAVHALLEAWADDPDATEAA